MSHRIPLAQPEELHSQVEFSSDQPQEGSPETQFRRRPDARFVRKFFSRDLRFPDGREYEIWCFEDDRSGRRFPAPPIRVVEGQVVHVTVEPSKSAHTIHLHGIEPDPRNDGVGHTSYEVTGSYTYQFIPNVFDPNNKPNSGSAGSYFYHCHVNTPLHVQMGMFGPLIIDPRRGRGWAFEDDPVGYDVRAETLLVPYEVDPRWHEMNHAAGLSGEDVGLHRFEPKSFYVLGGDLNSTSPPRGDVAVVGEVLVPAPGGKPGLMRVNNGSYMPTTIQFDGGLVAEVISHDGRPLRVTAGANAGAPVSLDTRANPQRPGTLAFGAAERYDIRLRAPSTAKPGDVLRDAMTVTWHDWITGRAPLATRKLSVRII